MMRIGIDFDNTIVCYDTVFFTVANETHLIAENIPTSKESVKNYLISKGKEEEWIKLQGAVYGNNMHLSSSYLEVEEFFKFASLQNFELCIISHKTLFPFLGPQYNLHDSAKNWLKRQPFYTEELQIFFELTKKAKLNRIQTMQCDYFIDDLPDILLDENFPKNTQRILFDPNESFPNNPLYITMRSWNEIIKFFSCCKTFTSC